MSVTGSCHCGAVRIALPRAPEWVASCNCSMCRRTGALVAYFAPGEVRVEGATATYVTGDRFLRFH
ncbi:MAG: GFA family protein, partial [Sphingomicrobium sp.]